MRNSNPAGAADKAAAISRDCQLFHPVDHRRRVADFRGDVDRMPLAALVFYHVAQRDALAVRNAK